MVAIVLTGEIGAGKSTVLSWFASQGDTVLDADDLVTQLWQRPDVLTRATAVWGKDIAPHGQLDRRRLAERAFASVASQKQLSALLHPLVRLEMEKRLPSHGLAVVEIPLVFESGRPWWAEGILFLQASLGLRSRRNEGRGLDEIELLRRERFFMDSSDRARASDWVIDNDGSVEDLHRQMLDLRSQLLQLDSLLELRFSVASSQTSLLDHLVHQKLLTGLSVTKDERNSEYLVCRGWSHAKLLSRLPELEALSISKSFAMKVQHRHRLLSILQ